jgi:ribosomal protein S18 acetylase RimI-like enzyme
VETGDVLGRSTTDVSVRPAVRADADAIGAVQARSWRGAYVDLLPAEVLEELTGPGLAPPWHAAIAAPPSPRHRVLVACSGSTVVGFVALGPSTDGDAGERHGELAALVVDPMHQRAGHGSRLLAAAADALRENAFDVVRVWVPEPDTALATLLTSAGLVPDGARRTHDAPGAADARVTELRLSAALG